MSPKRNGHEWNGDSKRSCFILDKEITACIIKLKEGIMKNIILLLTVVLSSAFMSCDMVIDAIQENAVCGQSLYDGSFPQMETIEDVSDYVMDNLTYVQDGVLTSLAGPEESLSRGYGDCDEYSLAFMDVAYYTLGLKFDFASVYVEDEQQRSVGIGGLVNHAVVSLNGQLYSVYNGTVITDYEASYYYSFDDVYIY